MRQGCGVKRSSKESRVYTHALEPSGGFSLRHHKCLIQFLKGSNTPFTPHFFRLRALYEAPCRYLKYESLTFPGERKFGRFCPTKGRGTERVYFGNEQSTNTGGGRRGWSGGGVPGTG